MSTIVLNEDRQRKRNDFSKLKHVKARAQGHSYTVFIGRRSVTAAERMLAREFS
ncbi:hypothetical protein [Pseudoxanthomonas mexicana]